MARESIYAVALDVEADYEPGTLPHNQIWNDARGPVFQSKVDAVRYMKSNTPRPGKENHTYEIQMTMYDIHAAVEYLLVGVNKDGQEISVSG